MRGRVIQFNDESKRFYTQTILDSDRLTLDAFTDQLRSAVSITPNCPSSVTSLMQLPGHQALNQKWLQ